MAIPECHELSHRSNHDAVPYRAQHAAPAPRASWPRPRRAVRASGFRVDLPSRVGPRWLPGGAAHRIRARRRHALSARLQWRNKPDGGLAGRASLRHGDPAPRCGLCPLGVPSLHELRQCRDPRHRAEGHRRQGVAARFADAGRAPRARILGAQPLGGRASADRSVGHPSAVPRLPATAPVPPHVTDRPALPAGMET